MGPTFNLIKKKTKALESFFTDRRSEGEGDLNFLFLLNLLSSTHEFLTVRFRRVKHEKCSMRRGLRVGTKNTGFQREFK